MTSLLGDRAVHRRAPLGEEVDLARDRVLIARAQDGDRGAFDELYLHYYRRLYRLCLRRLYDAHEAEDVAQEAFVRAWRALPRFCGDKRFYPWLSVIAANLCTDTLRKRNRATPVAEFFGADTTATGESPDEGLVASVDAQMVRTAYAKLSERHRRILAMREHSGMSYQAIAESEGVAVSAVETLLWRARQALKREFAAVAGADGRLAAWTGGLLSLSMLRKLLRGPAVAARRLGHAAPATAVAMGSAAAATAVMVATGVGTPSHTVPSSVTPPAQVVAAGVSPARAPESVGGPGRIRQIRLTTPERSPASATACRAGATCARPAAKNPPFAESPSMFVLLSPCRGAACYRRSVSHTAGDRPLRQARPSRAPRRTTMVAVGAAPA